MVMTTVVLACAPIGFMDCIASGAGEAVNVAGGDRVAVCVAAGGTVVDVGVTLGIAVVGDGGTAVRVGTAVSVTGVMLGRGVKEAINVGPGVTKMGAPTSRQPRSGAAPE